MQKYLFGLLAVVFTFLLGIQYQRWSQPDISAELRRLRSAVDQEKGAAAKPSAPLVIAPGSGLSREELREEIQTALRSMRATEEEPVAEDADSAAEDDRAEKRLTPEMIRVRDEATALIDSAVTRGTWFANDRAELHRLADQITDTQTQFELFRRVSAAINDGTLKPELDGPLL
jgi:hypothetical protein